MSRLGAAEIAAVAADRRGVDHWLRLFLRGWALVTAAIVLLIVLFLIVESVPALREIGLARFFSDPSWHPARSAGDGAFNLLPMVWGSLFLAGGALLLAAPAGLLSALFCRYYAPRPVATLYRRLIEVMAGVPSVVFGFWGLVTLVPLIRAWQPPGQSLLAGTLILALMILPTVALLAESALRAVPAAHWTQAAALGLGRVAILRGVALPIALPGVATGLLLALCRAVGETMAVLMVCGNIVQVPSSVFDPVRALTANIALEMGYATSAHRSALFVSGLVLMLVTAVLVAAAGRLERRVQHG